MALNKKHIRLIQAYVIGNLMTIQPFKKKKYRFDSNLQSIHLYTLSHTDHLHCYTLHMCCCIFHDSSPQTYHIRRLKDKVNEYTKVIFNLLFTSVEYYNDRLYDFVQTILLCKCPRLDKQRRASVDIWWDNNYLYRTDLQDTLNYTQLNRFR